MKNPGRIAFSTFVTLMLVAAFWAIWPAAGYSQPTAIDQQTAAAPLSVSGKITSVTENSFTLAVAGGQTTGQHFAEQEAKAKSMTFLVDKNTTVEGKIKVNANADVTYREENGKNVAISVLVTS